MSYLMAGAVRATCVLQSQSSNFGEVVREIKRQYDLDYVYCWHAMAGYWSGVMPEVRLLPPC